MNYMHFKNHVVKKKETKKKERTKIECKSGEKSSLKREQPSKLNFIDEIIILIQESGILEDRFYRQFDERKRAKRKKLFPFIFRFASSWLCV